MTQPAFVNACLPGALGEVPHPGIDPREFRQVAGCFTTGITIVTALDGDGRKVGLTANSFSTVSLDPPLVLWSLAKSSANAATFRRAGHFAIHILSVGQQALAERFATPVADRFAGLETSEGGGKVPIIGGCLARFECETFSVVDGGDHDIFLGRVVVIDREASDLQPLLFYRGAFCALPHV